MKALLLALEVSEELLACYSSLDTKDNAESEDGDRHEAEKENTERIAKLEPILNHYIFNFYIILI